MKKKILILLIILLIVLAVNIVCNLAFSTSPPPLPEASAELSNCSTQSPEPTIQPSIRPCFNEENPDDSSSPSMSATAGPEAPISTEANVIPAAPKTGADHSNIQITIILTTLIAVAIVVVKRIKKC